MIKRKVAIGLAVLMAFSATMFAIPKRAQAVGGTLIAQIGMNVVINLALQMLSPEIFDLINYESPTSKALNSIIDQTYELGEDMDVVIANTEEIIDTLGEIQVSITGMEQSLVDLQRAIDQGFADQSYESLIHELEEVDARMRPLWDAYVGLSHNITDPTHEYYKDETARNAAIESFMESVRLEYGEGASHSFADDLSTVYAQMSGTTTVTEAKVAADKVQYPFEHQVYAGAYNTFNYGVALQGMLLQLYWEYSIFNESKEGKDPSFNRDPQTEYDQFEFVGNTTIDRINEEGINAPMQDMMSAADIESSIKLNSGALETYHLKTNSTGEEFMIARQPMDIKELNGLSSTDYTMSDDAVWAVPNSLAEFETLLDNGVNNPHDWLTVQGNLPMDRIDAFTLSTVYPTENRQTLIGGNFVQSEYLHGSSGETGEFYLGFEADGSFVNTDMYFYSTASSISADSANIMPVYMKNSTDPSGVPKTGDTYEPTEPTQIPDVFTLNSGESLDFSHLKNYVFNQQIIVVKGDVEIKGADVPLHNLKIVLTENSHLILQDIAIENNDAQDYVIAANGQGAQLRIEGNVSITGHGCIPVYSGIGASMSIFSGGRENTLSIESNGKEQLGAHSDFEISDLTLNLTNVGNNYMAVQLPDAGGNKWAYYMNNCAVNFHYTSDHVNSIPVVYENCALSGATIYDTYAMYNTSNTKQSDTYVMTYKVSEERNATSSSGITISFSGTDVNGGRGYDPLYSGGGLSDRDPRTINFGRKNTQYLTVPDTVTIDKLDNGLIGSADGFVLDYIQLTGLTNDLTAHFGRIEIDDHDLHHYYLESYTSTNSYYSVPYTPHNFDSESNTSASVLAATADHFDVERIKSYLEELGSDEVFHVRLNEDTIHLADGELLQALMNGQGKLALEYELDRGSIVSLTYDSMELNAALQTGEYTGDFNFGDLLTSGHTSTHERWALDLSKNHALLGLADVKLHTADLYDVYDADGSTLLEISEKYETTDLGTLELPSDGEVQKIVFSRLIEKSPATGEAEETSHVSIWIVSIAMLAVCAFSAILMRKHAGRL